MNSVYKVIDWLNYWLSQDASNWHSIAWAVDYNPLLIGLHVIGGSLLSISFFVIAVLMSYAVYKRGFYSKIHQVVTWFFLTFLFLVSICFALKLITFFIPIFWIYGAVKVLAGVMAFMTAVLYAKYYKILSDLPTKKEMDVLTAERDSAITRNKYLTEHLDSWSTGVGRHIDILKSQHKVLAKQLAEKGLPVTSVDDIYSGNGKTETLKSLDVIEHELELLRINIAEEKDK